MLASKEDAMADLITRSPIIVGHSDRPRLDLPKLGIGAALSVLSKAVAQAFCMAYVEPYRTTRRQFLNAPDHPGEDGRDPKW
jgi:hypothetical protein